MTINGGSPVSTEQTFRDLLANANKMLIAAGIRVEFAVARKPHHDHVGQHAQHQLRDHGRYEKADTLPALILENHAVDHEADNAREENHKGVDDTLHQRQRHHVAVGNVTHFMAEHGFGFVGGKDIPIIQLADRIEENALVEAAAHGVRAAYCAADMTRPAEIDAMVATVKRVLR